MLDVMINVDGYINIVIDGDYVFCLDYCLIIKFEICG